jgi:colicin import membrane protein
MEATIEQPAAVQNGIVEYNPVLATLLALRQKCEGIVFDCSTTKGDADARKMRKSLVDLRVRLEDLRVDIKAPALQRTRDIDSVARAIREAIEKLETPIDEQIRAAEAVKEQARQERIAKEAARIGLIRQRIVNLFAAPAARMVGATTAEVQATITAVEAVPVDDTFSDLKIEAQTGKVLALEQLANHLVRAKKVDEQLAEIARRKAAVAEEERIAAAARAEQKAKDDAERAARLAADEAEREARRRAEAEARAAQKLIDDAAAEKLAAERRAFEEEQRVERAEAAERKRVADEAEERERRRQQAIADAETARRQAEERERRAAQERLEAEEAERRAAVMAAQARVERAAPTMLATLRHVREGMDRHQDEIEVSLLLSWIEDAIEEATGERPTARTWRRGPVAGPQEIAS